MCGVNQVSKAPMVIRLVLISSLMTSLYFLTILFKLGRLLVILLQILETLPSQIWVLRMTMIPNCTCLMGIHGSLKQIFPVHEAYPVRRVLLGPKGPLVLTELPGHKGYKVNRGLKESRDHPVSKASRAFQASKGYKVSRGLKARKERQGRLALPPQTVQACN